MAKGKCIVVYVPHQLVLWMEEVKDKPNWSQEFQKVVMQRMQIAGYNMDFMDFCGRSIDL